MDAGQSEKTNVRLTIFNQTYSLLVTGDPSDLEEAANEVDDLMNTIAKTGNADSARIAILACLHLQDRVHALEKELKQVKHSVDDRTRRLTNLLDQLEPGI